MKLFLHTYNVMIAKRCKTAGAMTHSRKWGLESKVGEHRNFPCYHAHIGDKRSRTAIIIIALRMINNYFVAYCFKK